MFSFMAKKQFTNIDTTGFGVRSSQSGRRLYKKDGSFNIKTKGLGFFDRLSIFHSMLTMPRWKFWLLLFSFFIGINLCFAFVYYLMGIDNLRGVHPGSDLQGFAEAFFFSTQTFTTVGYGGITPDGLFASSVAAFEAFLGLLTFALATGLFYGRFSRPRAFLRFSEHALISPYKDGAALMFRTVPYKSSPLMEAEVKLTAAMRMQDGDNERNYFYNLNVEFSKINALAMNWTIVHPLDEESPLTALSIAEMKKSNLEILVYLKGYDEGFANTVIARTSYTADEIIEGAKFVPMYHSSSSGDETILELDKLNDYEKVALPKVMRAVS